MSIDIQEYEITHISDWIPVSQIPTARSTAYNMMNEKYGMVGVYQVALTRDVEEISQELIHEKIGYTGKSSDILGRTYNIRAPKGSHGASRYIRQLGLDRDTEVCIRYIYCPETKYTDLENKIFSDTLEKFGYRFLWTDASAGTSGKYSQMIDLASDLSSEELLSAIVEIKELAIEKNQLEFIKKFEITISGN